MEQETEPCRLCLTSSNNNVCILGDYDLINKVKECVSIQILPTDIYSKFVCPDCVGKIRSCYDFKMMCLNSKTILEAQVDVKQQIDIKENNIVKLGCGVQQDETVCDEVKSSRNRNIYSCYFCIQTFEYYVDYLEHRNGHDGEPVFDCEQCDSTFTRRQDLVGHEKTHMITCHICGTVVRRQSIKLHLTKHTDRFKCGDCSLTFTCARLLRDHIASKHMKMKPYVCDTCGKSFGTKSSLVLHLKIHSEVKEYQCDKCDYAGKTSISVKIHKSKHETGTHICEYCSKIFKSNRNLSDHSRRVHRPNKKFSCDICGMRFSLRYLVEQHKRVHTGIHPYKCSDCFKTFARSCGLKEHLRTHYRTEIYKCDDCTKFFRTKRGRKRHNCARIILSVKSE